MVVYVYKIPIVEMLRKEHYHEFEANLVYISRHRPTSEIVLKKQTYSEAAISVYEIVHHKLCQSSRKGIGLRTDWF